MAAAKSNLQKLLDLIGDFVVKQNGCWEHDEWETLVAKAHKLGVTLDDEGKRNLGNMLEAAKHFYHLAPPPAKKKTAAKKTTAKKTAAKKRSSR